MEPVNGTNLCAGLLIPTVGENEAQVSELYKRQLKLQERLKQIPQALVVSKLIYWRHCIHTECDELLEWEGNNVKEMRMEMVDILHFVFNLGISCKIDPRDVQWTCDNTEMKMPLTQNTLRARLMEGICNLSETLSKFIDLFPWKEWKHYPEDFVPDHQAIVEAYGTVVLATYSLGHLLTMDSLDIAAYFIAKNEENHARQDRGY